MSLPLDRLRALAGGVLTVGLPSPVAAQGELEALAELVPAGVILFARNVSTPEDLAALTASVRAALGRPLILLDQEGGRVDRLKAILGPSPSARRLAAAGAAAVSRHAELTADALRFFGVTVNCTPVVDLDEGHESNGIGDRSFGSDPDRVAELAALVLEAHRERAVVPCLKHFPGLGRTRGDTHLLRPTVEASEEALRGRDLVPYRRLLGRGAAVMVGHAAYPALSGDDRPASLSRRVVTGLLREELGHDGLVVTDDLEMGGVGDLRPGARAVAALRAGCDLLLFCHALSEAVVARDAIVEAVQEGTLEEGRLEQAAARVSAAADAAPAGVEHAPGELERLREGLRLLNAEIGRPST